MNKIKSFRSFNEAAITPTNFTEMMDKLRDSLLEKEEQYYNQPIGTRHPMMVGPGGLTGGQINKLNIEEANEIGNQYNVYFVSYDTFYNGLPDNLKSTAPPRRGGPPFFGYVSENQQIRIVLTNGSLSIMDLGYLNHMVQHESIHIGQRSRRSLSYALPDPNNQKSYFSDKDEIMAFSQSIVDMMKTDRYPIHICLFERRSSFKKE